MEAAEDQSSLLSILQYEEKILSFFDKIDYNCDGYISWVSRIIMSLTLRLPVLLAVHAERLLHVYAIGVAGEGRCRSEFQEGIAVLMHMMVHIALKTSRWVFNCRLTWSHTIPTKIQFAGYLTRVMARWPLAVR